MDRLQQTRQTPEYLEQTNHFLIPLDDSSVWFRYHHPFQDLLRIRLQKKLAFSPDFSAQLHHKAAVWFEQNDFPGEDIHHSIEAQDFEKACCLVEKYTTALFVPGELHSLMDWIDLLLAEYVNRPWFGIYKAWVLAFSGKLDAAGDTLLTVQQIMTQMNGTPEEMRALRLELLAIDTMRAVMNGDCQTALSNVK